MEKKRRERINRSLEELKRLVLQAQNRDVSTMTSRIYLRKEEGLKIEKKYCYMTTFFFLLEQCFSFCPADKFKEVLKLLVLFT